MANSVLIYTTVTPASAHEAQPEVPRCEADHEDGSVCGTPLDNEGNCRHWHRHDVWPDEDHRPEPFVEWPEDAEDALDDVAARFGFTSV